MIVVYFYNLLFKETESYLMLGICCFVNAFGGLNSMLLIKGYTYGMDPTTFVFVTNTVTDTL